MNRIYWSLLAASLLALGMVSYTSNKGYREKCEKVGVLEAELNQKEYEIEELKKVNRLALMQIEKLERTNSNVIESNKTYVEIIRHFNEHTH